LHPDTEEERMPDRHGFDHLGQTEHRCIEEGCEFGGRLIPEGERKRHAAQHARSRAQDARRRQLDAIRRANAARRLAERENALVAERYERRLG
jgi:hypothetical protein